MNFNSLMPELYVRDYKKSLSFYTYILGFKIEYTRTDPDFAFLSYNGAQLMLQQIEPQDEHTGVLEHPFGRGINFEIKTPDIKSLHENLVKNNFPLKKDLTEYWRDIGEEKRSGSLELQVLDPDGYFLRFSQDLGKR